MKILQQLKDKFLNNNFKLKGAKFGHLKKNIITFFRADDNQCYSFFASV